MNAQPGRWRRVAVKLAQHASWVLPGARSPWADAMRRELDYIKDDPAALRWALGCILASYRARLAHRPSLSAWRLRAPATWRHVAASGALMLLIGLALQDNAGGQTEPPRPAFDETTCNLHGVSPEISPNDTVSVPRNHDNLDVGRFRSDCADPLPAAIPDPPEHDPEKWEPVFGKDHAQTKQRGR